VRVFLGKCDRERNDERFFFLSMRERLRKGVRKEERERERERKSIPSLRQVSV